MFDPPKTLEEARAYRYNKWAGNPKGMPYREGRCAYQVHHWPLFAQCNRKNGRGPAGLYCWQHAKMVEERLSRK